MNSIDEKGKRYGRLLVLHEFAEANRVAAKWVCRCDCGTETIVRGNALRSGTIRSCGCLQKEKARRVGLRKKKSRGNALDWFDEDIL